jgi:PAS domain S-box-containing protein
VSAALRLFGYQRTELLGKNVNILIPQPIAQAHDRYIADYARSGEEVRASLSACVATALV